MGKADALASMMKQSMASSVQPAQRTIETITGEIVELKKQAGEAILGIGQRLIEAKEMLSHGEWLPWLTEQVEFSPRTAQNFMRLAREWSNTQTLADLGASKALTLLALPAEERDSFIQEHNVIDMSARQLEQAIKERDQARQAAEQAEADKRAAEQARDKMAEDMAIANAALEATREERQRADAEARRLESELSELKARPVEVAVETVVDQAAIDQARAQAIAEMQDKLDKAREATAKAREKQKRAEASVEILKRTLEEREKAYADAVLLEEQDMERFELLLSQSRKQADQMREILVRAREKKYRQARSLERALKAMALIYEERAK